MIHCYLTLIPLSGSLEILCSVIVTFSEYPFIYLLLFIYLFIIVVDAVVVVVAAAAVVVVVVAVVSSRCNCRFFSDVKSKKVSGQHADNTLQMHIRAIAAGMIFQLAEHKSWFRFISFCVSVFIRIIIIFW